MRVIVVGGGILGASVAYHLAVQGAETVLVDRNDLGRATAAGAGIVSPLASGSEEPANDDLLEAGAAFYPELVARLAEDGETDLGYARVGSLLVPDEAADLAAAEARVRARVSHRAGAAPVQRLSPKEAQSLFPPLRPGLAALFVPGARVDGRRLTAALRRAGVKHGVRDVEGSVELAVSGARAVGVRLGDELIEADAVVVAAGAWAPALLRPIGIQLAVEPQRGQIVHLRRAGTDTSVWPVVLPLNGYYLLAFEDSRVVVGASREFGTGFDYRLTAAGVAGVLNAGLHTAPGLAEWTLDEIRIGFRPLATHGVPLLGPVPSIEGLWIGNGLGPSGLTMGPVAGALLAYAVLGRPTRLPLDPYNPARSAAATVTG